MLTGYANPHTPTSPVSVNPPETSSKLNYFGLPPNYVGTKTPTTAKFAFQEAGTLIEGSKHKAKCFALEFYT